jgi:hypothetical protein
LILVSIFLTILANLKQGEINEKIQNLSDFENEICDLVTKVQEFSFSLLSLQI